MSRYHKNKEPSFEQALHATMTWCKAWEEGELSDEVLADRVAELIKTIKGARGFFAIALSIDCPLLDRLPETLIFQLRESGDEIVSLTIKNLIMSSAMSIHHEREENNLQKEGSLRVQKRCIELLRRLEPRSLKRILEKFLAAIESKISGEEFTFLEKLNYDEKQKKQIILALNSVAEYK